MSFRLHTVLLLCYVSNLGIFCAQPRVDISSGIVKGKDITLSNGKVVHAFLGIPYALPPVAEHRFEEPKPYDKWEGTWNGTTFTRPCIQFSLQTLKADGEEDCLYVNVFTPKLPKDSNQIKNDVIVWFHGGSFMHGTGNYLKPEYLLRWNDVVFVSVNYRLAMFGFYSTDDDVVPGNNGLKDQLLALQWVQKNIEKFGGNPNSVTIAGISAGASAVHFLTLSPSSKGLFQKAIMASGTALQPWLLLGKTVPIISKRLASIAGCPTNSSIEMVKCLKTRPAIKIANSYKNLLIWRQIGYLFGPVIEPAGKNRFLQRPPIALLRNGTDKIPCLMSVVEDEGYVGLSRSFDDEEVLEQMNKEFEKIAPHLLFYYHKLPNHRQLLLTSNIRRVFFNNQSIVTDENYPKLIQLLGDRLITTYVEFAIREHTRANLGPIYYAKLNYSGEHSTIPTKMNHGDDMMYLIKSNDYRQATLTSTQDEQMAKIMSNIWASFAKTGKPEINNTNANINWPAVSKNQRNIVEYLRINSADDLRIESTENVDSFEFWNNSLNEFPEQITNEIIKDEL